LVVVASSALIGISGGVFLTATGVDDATAGGRGSTTGINSGVEVEASGVFMAGVELETISGILEIVEVASVSVDVA